MKTREEERRESPPAYVRMHTHAREQEGEKGDIMRERVARKKS